MRDPFHDAGDRGDTQGLTSRTKARSTSASVMMRLASMRSRLRLVEREVSMRKQVGDTESMVSERMAAPSEL